jgi:alkanesulfonate monooxygenase SsuD/methylene tetrahydromethanopterin reductase-like flavin-dependent oxidoreductase (luciferase family)
MPLRPLLLAAALADPRPEPDPSWWTAQARAAEAAGLDFVTIEDGPLDPLLTAARLAAQTARIGILAAAPTTTTEPFHVSTAIATIDVVAQGRGGWLAEVVDRQDADGLVTWDVPDDVVGDAREHVEVVRRLWDSWEDGAIIRDGATDRFLDRERVHHVDFRGEHVAVRGPSITPRPPQGHPVVALRATGAATLALAAEVADVVITADPDAARVPGVLQLLELADGDALADRIVAHHVAGFDGVLLRADDLAATLGDLIPALAARGVAALDAPPGQTLRARLGLAAATNRYALPVA